MHFYMHSYLHKIFILVKSGCYMKHPNFDLMHSISCFSQFVFDGFITKRGENMHKVGRTLLLTGWLREEI
jgi:hypothetical protein